MMALAKLGRVGRVRLARSPDITFSAAKELAESGEWAALMKLAENPYAPPEILKEMSEATEEEEEPIGFKSLEWTAFVRRHRRKLLKQTLAANPSMLKKERERLAGSPTPLVRSGAAMNPAITPEERLKLGQDLSEIVRAYLAKNPATKAQDLSEMALDLSSQVRLEVARRPETPDDVLVYFIKNDLCEKVRYSADKERARREKEKGNESCPILN